MRYSLLLLLFSSCGLIKGVGGNPDPELKRIHMWEYHRGYTELEYHQHPDYDCFMYGKQ